MHRFRFQLAMARFALLAMLLLAALPTAGRLATSSRGEPGWAGLCTSAGLKWVQLGRHSAPAVAHDGDDCTYCPLLQALDAPIVAPLQLSSPLPQTAFAVESPSSRTSDAPLSGLGARGPPRQADAIA